MKYILALGLIPFSLATLAADVDYSYCQKNFNPNPDMQFGGSPDFPFRMDKDGKVRAHKDATYTFDKESNTETIKYKIKGFGDYTTDFEVVIKRDENGAPTQIIQNNAFKGFKSETGLGSTNKGFMGMPGYGMGLGMGMMASGPSKYSTVYDIKVKSGKCFPYRTTSLVETNGNTHKSFVNDVELCRDIKKMLKEEGTEGSEANKLKACYEQYQDKAQKILSGHLKRNDDLYNPPKSKEEVTGPWGSGGYYANPYQGSYGGSEGYGAGGFAGSIDNIVENKSFNPSEKIKMLAEYCKFPFGAIDEMTKDESLFKEEVSSSQKSNSAADPSVHEK